MIRLWNNTEQNFKGNKWVLNESSKANVNDITNGEFSLDFEYPLQDEKGLSKYLIRGNLITCPVKDGRPEQQFRIRKVEKTSSSVVVYAESKLIADLKANRVRTMSIPVGLTRKQAIQMVLDSALEPHNFVVGNLDTNTTNNIIVNIKEGSVLEALIGKENSILSEFGGEFLINNNEFNIVDFRGSNHGFTIAYGKNISSIKETTDDTDLATTLIPKSGDYRLPEYCIDSPNVGAYEKRYFQEVDMNLDIWDGKNEKKEDQITLNQAYAIMRTTCNDMFIKDKVDQINFNYSIDLVALSKTEEYKEYSILEISNNGDTVKIKHKLLNLDLIGRVNKTIYNVLLDEYATVEIGFTKQDIMDIIKTAVKSIQFAKDEIMLSVENSISGVEATLAIQDGKISAVVESSDGGMTWQLSKDAFVVACKGASNSNVTIDANGLTVNNGKFLLKDNGNIVFQVDTNGICNAIGGFIVRDGSTYCKINNNGLEILGTSGYVGTIEAHPEHNGLYLKNDLYVDDFTTGGDCHVTEFLDVAKSATIRENLFINNGTLKIDGSDILTIIDKRIVDKVKAESLK